MLAPASAAAAAAAERTDGVLGAARVGWAQPGLGDRPAVVSREFVREVLLRARCPLVEGARRPLSSALMSANTLRPSRPVPADNARQQR